MTQDFVKSFLTPCQVRGTPASGKTSLAELIRGRIHQQEHATAVIWVQGWSRERCGPRWDEYLKMMGWVPLQIGRAHV